MDAVGNCSAGYFCLRTNMHTSVYFLDNYSSNYTSPNSALPNVSPYGLRSCMVYYRACVRECMRIYIDVIVRASLYALLIACMATCMRVCCQCGTRKEYLFGLGCRSWTSNIIIFVYTLFSFQCKTCSIFLELPLILYKVFSVQL